MLGEEHPDTLVAVSELDILLQVEGKLTEAEPYCREAYEKQRRLLGDEHLDTLISLDSLAGLLNAQKKFAEAEGCPPAEPSARTVFTNSNATRLGQFLMRLGQARTGLGDFAEADRKLREAYPLLVQNFGPDGKTTRKCVTALVSLYTAWHAAKPREGHDRESAEWEQKLKKITPPTTAEKPQPRT